MIKKLWLKSVCLTLLFAVCSVEAEVVRDYTLSQKEEQISGKRFVHRREFDGGKRSENWVVEGAVVSQDRFEEMYLEAKAEELREVRARERVMHEEAELFSYHVQRGILQKLLKALVEECREHISLIERNELDTYMVFSPSTIKDSATYVLLTQKRLDEVLTLASDENADLATLKKEEQDLTESCSRLKKFVRATINRAVEQCTDTKLLKKLLNDVELV